MEDNNKVADDFLFPYSTCETPNKEGIVQPFSFILNCISCFVILYFLFQTKKIWNFLLLVSFLLFEGIHTFSHAVHLPNNIQVSLIHPLVYFINIFYLIIFCKYTHKLPNIYFAFLLFCLFIFDIYAFINLAFIYYFTSAMIIFIFIFMYYYNYFERKDKQYIKIILGLALTIIFLFYNEHFNCKTMLSVFPNFPFHIFPELTGVITFYYISKFSFNL